MAATPSRGSARASPPRPRAPVPRRSRRPTSSTRAARPCSGCRRSASGRASCCPWCTRSCRCRRSPWRPGRAGGAAGRWRSTSGPRPGTTWAATPACACVGRCRETRWCCGPGSRRRSERCAAWRWTAATRASDASCTRCCASSCSSGPAASPWSNGCKPPSAAGARSQRCCRSMASRSSRASSRRCCARATRRPGSRRCPWRGAGGWSWRPRRSRRCGRAPTRVCASWPGACSVAPGRSPSWPPFRPRSGREACARTGAATRPGPGPSKPS